MKPLFVIVHLFVLFVVPTGAQAPSAQAPRPRSDPRIELSVGAGFLSGSDLGDADANLRGRSGQDFQLFTTSSRIAASIPVEVRLDYLLGPRYVLELKGAWSQPELQTSVSDDIEGAPTITVGERVNQYSLDAGLVINVGRQRRYTPFLSAGVGYVAAVHEGLTLLDNGMSYRGGGGIKYPLVTRARGLIRGVGIRADAALVVMTNGLASGTGATSQIATSGSLYLVF